MDRILELFQQLGAAAAGGEGGAGGGGGGFTMRIHRIGSGNIIPGSPLQQHPSSSSSAATATMSFKPSEVFPRSLFTAIHEDYVSSDSDFGACGYANNESRTMAAHGDHAWRLLLAIFTGDTFAAMRKQNLRRAALHSMERDLLGDIDRVIVQQSYSPEAMLRCWVLRRPHQLLKFMIHLLATGVTDEMSIALTHTSGSAATATGLQRTVKHAAARVDVFRGIAWILSIIRGASVRQHILPAVLEQCMCVVQSALQSGMWADAISWTRKSLEETVVNAIPSSATTTATATTNSAAAAQPAANTTTEDGEEQKEQQQQVQEDQQDGEQQPQPSSSNNNNTDAVTTARNEFRVKLEREQRECLTATSRLLGMILSPTVNGKVTINSNSGRNCTVYNSSSSKSVLKFTPLSDAEVKSAAVLCPVQSAALSRVVGAAVAILHQIEGRRIGSRGDGCYDVPFWGVLLNYSGCGLLFGASTINTGASARLGIFRPPPFTANALGRAATAAQTRRVPAVPRAVSIPDFTDENGNVVNTANTNAAAPATAVATATATGAEQQQRYQALRGRINELQQSADHILGRVAALEQLRGRQGPPLDALTRRVSDLNNNPILFRHSSSSPHLGSSNSTSSSVGLTSAVLQHNFTGRYFLKYAREVSAVIQQFVQHVRDQQQQASTKPSAATANDDDDDATTTTATTATTTTTTENAVAAATSQSFTVPLYTEYRVWIISQSIIDVLRATPSSVLPSLFTDTSLFNIDSVLLPLITLPWCHKTGNNFQIMAKALATQLLIIACICGAKSNSNNSSAHQQQEQQQQQQTHPLSFDAAIRTTLTRAAEDHTGDNLDAVFAGVLAVLRIIPYADSIAEAAGVGKGRNDDDANNNNDDEDDDDSNPRRRQRQDDDQINNDNTNSHNNDTTKKLTHDIAKFFMSMLFDRYLPAKEFLLTQPIISHSSGNNSSNNHRDMDMNKSNRTGYDHQTIAAALEHSEALFMRSYILAAPPVSLSNADEPGEPEPVIGQLPTTTETRSIRETFEIGMLLPLRKWLLSPTTPSCIRTAMERILMLILNDIADNSLNPVLRKGWMMRNLPAVQHEMQQLSRNSNNTPTATTAQPTATRLPHNFADVLRLSLNTAVVRCAREVDNFIEEVSACPDFDRGVAAPAERPSLRCELLHVSELIHTASRWIWRRLLCTRINDDAETKLRFRLNNELIDDELRHLARAVASRGCFVLDQQLRLRTALTPAMAGCTGWRMLSRDLVPTHNFLLEVRCVVIDALCVLFSDADPDLLPDSAALLLMSRSGCTSAVATPRNADHVDGSGSNNNNFNDDAARTPRNVGAEEVPPVVTRGSNNNNNGRNDDADDDGISSSSTSSSSSCDDQNSNIKNSATTLRIGLRVMEHLTELSIDVNTNTTSFDRRTCLTLTAARSESLECYLGSVFVRATRGFVVPLMSVLRELCRRERSMLLVPQFLVDARKATAASKPAPQSVLTDDVLAVVAAGSGAGASVAKTLRDFVVEAYKQQPQLHGFAHQQYNGTLDTIGERWFNVNRPGTAVIVDRHGVTSGRVNRFNFTLDPMEYHLSLTNFNDVGDMFFDPFDAAP